MKIDRYIKDISDKLHNVTNNGNDNDIIDNDNPIDDYYYIDRKQEPPRFLCYRHIRVKKCTDDYRKKSLQCVFDTITQDELDYALKRELRLSPQQRYQNAKSHYYFHDHAHPQGLQIQGYCNGFTGCVLECRYFGDYGRIEDEEVIEKHSKLVEYYRQLRSPNGKDNRQYTSKSS